MSLYPKICQMHEQTFSKGVENIVDWISPHPPKSFRVKVVIGALGNRLLQNPVANSNVSSIPVDYLFTIGLKYFWENIYQINLPLGPWDFHQMFFLNISDKQMLQKIFLPNILCPGHTLRWLFLYSRLRFLCFSFIFLRLQKILNEWMYIENVNPIQPELIGLEPWISKIKGELVRKLRPSARLP